MRSTDQRNEEKYVKNMQIIKEIQDDKVYTGMTTSRTSDHY